MTSRSF